MTIQALTRVSESGPMPQRMQIVYRDPTEAADDPTRGWKLFDPDNNQAPDSDDMVGLYYGHDRVLMDGKISYQELLEANGDERLAQALEGKLLDAFDLVEEAELLALENANQNQDKLTEQLRRRAKRRAARGGGAAAQGQSSGAEYLKSRAEGAGISEADKAERQTQLEAQASSGTVAGGVATGSPDTGGKPASSSPSVGGVVTGNQPVQRGTGGNPANKQ